MARYKMRQRLISIGDDFEIEDERGNPIYRVDGKILRFRETFVLEDLSGNEVVTIREKKLSLHDSMNLLRGGEVVATIRKAWLTAFRDKFDIDVKGGTDMVAKGDILDHEYEIHQGGETVAKVSKRWFTIRDTYGIDIVPGQDDGLLLAVAVAIDEMVHDPEEQSQG